MPADASVLNVVGNIYAFTALGVGVILAAAGLGSALGWGLICSKYMEGIARQPEMQPTLLVQMFITAGLMESFPFIILAFAMFFTFANPFVSAAVDAAKTAAHALGGS
jgi:F-type H+-transporting ATPase subunit c